LYLIITKQLLKLIVKKSNLIILFVSTIQIDKTINIKMLYNSNLYFVIYVFYQKNKLFLNVFIWFILLLYIWYNYKESILIFLIKLK
jgi:hypothetical protein